MKGLRSSSEPGEPTTQGGLSGTVWESGVRQCFALPLCFLSSFLFAREKGEKQAKQERQSRQESLGKEEGCRKPETFRWNPVGNQSHPAEPGQQREASLASWRATVRAKRRQPGVRAGLLSPVMLFVAGVPTLCRGGDRAAFPYRPGLVVLPGSLKLARPHQGSPGTWETCIASTVSFGL